MAPISSQWQWVPAALLLVCLASFAWGMECFFVRPEGMTRGMRLIGVLGAVFGSVHVLTLLSMPSRPAQRAAASAMYLCALGLYWWAISVNRRRPLSAAFSSDAPVGLVQRGPYRFVRHPFYCSYLLTWTAGAAATGTWWLMLTVVVMLAIYIYAARLEERKFQSTDLAGLYETYRSRTGRFLPNPMKLLVASRRAL